MQECEEDDEDSNEKSPASFAINFVFTRPSFDLPLAAIHDEGIKDELLWQTMQPLSNRGGMASTSASPRQPFQQSQHSKPPTVDVPSSTSHSLSSVWSQLSDLHDDVTSRNKEQTNYHQTRGTTP